MDQRIFYLCGQSKFYSTVNLSIKFFSKIKPFLFENFNNQKWLILTSCVWSAGIGSGPPRPCTQDKPLTMDGWKSRQRQRMTHIDLLWHRSGWRGWEPACPTRRCSSAQRTGISKTHKHNFNTSVTFCIHIKNYMSICLSFQIPNVLNFETKLWLKLLRIYNTV